MAPALICDPSSNSSAEEWPQPAFLILPLALKPNWCECIDFSQLCGVFPSDPSHSLGLEINKHYHWSPAYNEPGLITAGAGVAENNYCTVTCLTFETKLFKMLLILFCGFQLWVANSPLTLLVCFFFNILQGWIWKIEFKRNMKVPPKL